ncbi:MAG: ABC transporter permease [Gemmatimonadota bacterium]
MAPPATAPPLTILEPPRRWDGPPLRELWRFRDLLGTLALRDLKVRYKQTVLGLFWVLAQPFAAAGVFAFVFGRVASLEAPGGVPYFLFTFAGLQAWLLFSNTLTRSTNALVGNFQLVQKVYFPRLILPLSTVVASLLDFLIVMVLFTVLLLLQWHLPGVEVLWAPVCLALLLALALGLGFASSALAVAYRDVRHAQPVLTQLLLYASPVAYAVTVVPERYRGVYLLNPIAPILETFRYALLGTGDPPWTAFGIAAAVCVVVFIGGMIVFTRLDRMFADVI